MRSAWGRRSLNQAPLAVFNKAEAGDIRPILLIAILVGLVYVPGVYFGNGLPTFHVEDPIIILCALFCIAGKFGVYTVINPGGKILLLSYMVLIIWFLISTVLNLQSEITDLSNVAASMFKAISMWRGLAYLIVLHSFVRTERHIKWVQGSLVVIGVVQVVIFFLQKFDLYGINTSFTPLYSLVLGSSEYSLLGFRADGSYGNPNHAAVAMVPIGAIAYSMYMHSMTREKIKRLVCMFASIGLLGSAVLLTQSRSGAAGLCAALIIITVLSRRSFGRLIQIVLVSIGVGAIIIPAIMLTNGDFVSRFNAFSSVDMLWNDDSLATRREMWEAGIGVMSGSDFLIGRGFSGYIKIGWLDSGYMDYFFTVGIIGVFLFIVMIFVSVVLSWSAVANARRCGGDGAASVAGLATCVAVLVTTVSHPLMYQDKIWILYITIIFLGLKAQGLAARRPNAGLL